MNRLLEIGFEKVGHWETAGDKISFTLPRMTSRENILIFALPDGGLFHYGRFHLNLAAGLEDDLIRVVDPEGNGGRKDTGETGGSVTGQARLEPERTDSCFPLVLHPTYYHSGFFNVRVSHASLLGGDGETIELHVADRPTPILGMINRTANANETPRIMGGTELRDWLHSAADEGDTIRVNVISPNAVELVLEGNS